MNKKVREPFFWSYMTNMILSILIIGLTAAAFFTDMIPELCLVLIFAMAVAANFIAAMVSFVRMKRIRGNLYAVLCTLFLIMAVFLGIRYFWGLYG